MRQLMEVRKFPIYAQDKSESRCLIRITRRIRWRFAASDFRGWQNYELPGAVSETLPGMCSAIRERASGALGYPKSLGRNADQRARRDESYFASLTPLPDLPSSPLLFLDLGNSGEARQPVQL